MRRALLSLLLAGAVGAQPVGMSEGGGIRTSPDFGLGGPGLVTGGGTQVISLLLNGQGQSAMATGTGLATTFASEMTGALQFVFNGDATSTGLAFTGTGSPTAVTPPVCNNGPDCTAYAAQQLLIASSQGFLTANTASPTGDYSGFAVVRIDAYGAGNSVITAKLSGATYILGMFISSAGILNAAVNKGAGGTVVAGSVALTPRAWHTVGFSYDFVADGSSVLRLYQDGVAVGTPSTTAVGPIAAASTPYTIGYRSDDTLFMSGAIGAVIGTEKVLSAATIASMHTAALGTLTLSSGTAVTSSRSGVLTCTNDDWEHFTTQPAARPCVAANGLEVAPAATNLAIRSEELDNAAWTATDVTVAANIFESPDGTTTAERFTPSDAAGCVETATPFVITGTSATASFFIQSALSAPVAIELEDTTAAAVRISIGDFPTPTWRRVSGSSAAIVSGNNHVLRFCGSDAGDVFSIFGVQVETGAAATPYVRTEAATVTRAIGSYNFTKPDFVTDAAGCASATTFAYNAVANARILGTAAAGGPTFLYVADVNRFGIYDATTITQSAAGTGLAGRSAAGYSWWSGSSQSAAIDGVAGTTGAFDGTLVATPVYLGTSAGTGNGFHGRISNIKLGGTTEACR